MKKQKLDNHGEQGTDNKKHKIADKILFSFSDVRTLFFFVLGCLIAHFIIGPLLFGSS